MLASNPASMVNHISPRRGKTLRVSVLGKCSSSSLVEPTSTALFEPAELNRVCAEAPSAPEARATPPGPTHTRPGSTTSPMDWRSGSMTGS